MFKNNKPLIFNICIFILSPFNTIILFCQGDSNLEQSTCKCVFTLIIGGPSKDTVWSWATLDQNKNCPLAYPKWLAHACLVNWGCMLAEKKINQLCLNCKN